MNDPEIEQRFHLMQKELEATATLLKDAKAEMAAAIDARKIGERDYGSGGPGLSRSLLRYRNRFKRRLQRLRLWSRKSRQEMLFANREDAAKLLAQRLSAYCEKDNPLVLAIPRGAVPMARMIADALTGSLDVVLVRKLGHPEQPELAIGAIDERGNTFFSAWAAEVSPTYIESEKQRQLAVLQTRRAQYTPMHDAIDPCGRLVVVVDDGIATGATMIAALRSVRVRQPKKLIAAVAVASMEAAKLLRSECDALVCLETPADFSAVGQFFNDFSQVSDQEVMDLLSARQEKASACA